MKIYQCSGRLLVLTNHFYTIMRVLGSNLPKIIHFFYYYFELKTNGNKSEGVLSVSLGSEIDTDISISYCLIIFPALGKRYARPSDE